MSAQTVNAFRTMANRTGLHLRAPRSEHDEQRSCTEPEDSESGFTLIELMVLLLIMAILLAIATPTLLGVKGGAHDCAAQSNLTHALTEAKALHSMAGCTRAPLRTSRQCRPINLS